MPPAAARGVAGDEQASVDVAEGVDARLAVGVAGVGDFDGQTLEQQRGGGEADPVFSMLVSFLASSQRNIPAPLLMSLQYGIPALRQGLNVALSRQHQYGRASPISLQLEPASALKRTPETGLRYVRQPSASRTLNMQRIARGLMKGAYNPCRRRKISAARSPTIAHGACVLPVVTLGRIEPSETRSRSMP